MAGVFNGRFENQRNMISRHFDKVLLGRVLFVLIACGLLLIILLLYRFTGTDSEGRVLGIVSDFANTLNNAITTTVGFIGGVITGVALTSGSRTGDKPAPTTPPEPEK